MSSYGDDIERGLRLRLIMSSGAICSVMDSCEPGLHRGKEFRSALREAVQRRDSAQHDLDHHVHRAAHR